MKRRSFLNGLAAFVGSLFSRRAPRRLPGRHMATEPVFIGRMPERTELTILAIDPSVRPITFVSFENVSVGLTEEDDA